MTYTYDPTTDVGRCRLLVRDVNADADEDLAFFQDEDYVAFLAIEGDVRLAAAAALETLASNEALDTGVLKAGPVSLDGVSVSDALLRRAAILRTQAGIFDSSGRMAAFDIAETVSGPFSMRERIYNDALRQGG